MSFRAIAKFGLLLVIIGFFMPVACDRTGFEIAEYCMKSHRDGTTLNGLLMYVTFMSAVVGVAIGVLLIIKKKKSLDPKIDWIIIIACIASGLIVYFNTALSDQNIKLQTGAYFILIGWVGALAAQILSKLKREK